jgi:hypothetical protein
MATGPTQRLRRFVSVQPEVEAVLQHVGLRTWDLILVDVDGNWIREVFPTPAHAGAACRRLGIRMHEGWDEPRLARRMSRRDHWGRPGGQRRAL